MDLRKYDDFKETARRFPVGLLMPAVCDEGMYAFPMVAADAHQIGTAYVLVSEGKVQLQPLMSKVFPFGQYQQAYEYIDSHRETSLKILIDVQDTAGIVV